MSVREQIFQKIQSLPEPLVREVNDFVDFLLSRYDHEQESLTSAQMAKIAAEGGAFDWLDEPEEEGLYSDLDGEPV